MDRRHFMTSTGAFLGLLGLGFPAEAKDDKKAAKRKNSVAKKTKRPPLPFVPGSWTIVILPDVQNYSDHYPGLLRMQTEWIVKNRDKQNIVYVLQNGDLTNRSSDREWKNASRGLGVLDTQVPYALVPGNHDYGKGSPKNRSTKINEYFPPSRFQKWRTFGGTMEPGRIENNYHLFNAGGKQWLVIGLEWGPRDTTLEWAGRVLKKYYNRKAIVFTHAYLYNDSTRYNWAKKGKKQTWNPHAYGTAGGVNDGEEMWQKLIKKHPNVFLMMNGHVCGDGLGFQVSEGEHGNRVNEMLVDYQVQPIGGGAWMRLLEFLPDGKTVQVRAYSPLYEQFETSPDNQFTFTIE